MRVWKSFGIDPDNPDDAPVLDDVEKGAAEIDNRLAYFLEHDADLAAVISVDDLRGLLEKDSIAYHTARVDDIFKRVFG